MAIVHCIGRTCVVSLLCVSVVPLATLIMHCVTSTLKGNRVWLLLERIHDTHNLGAMLRTAMFFGVERVLLHDCARANAAVARASAGAAEWLCLHILEDPVATARVAKTAGWDVVGTDALPMDRSSKSTDHTDGCPCVSLEHAVLTKPSIICFGNEGDGLRKQTLAACDYTVGIPRRGPSVAGGGGADRRRPLYELDSLNVSVSCGVVLAALTSSLRHSNTTAHTP